MNQLEAATFIFARAISNLLEEGEGVIVNPTENQFNVFGKEDEALIVGKIEGQIMIFPISDTTDDPRGFKEGQIIKIITEQ